MSRWVFVSATVLLGVLAASSFYWYGQMSQPMIPRLADVMITAPCWLSGNAYDRMRCLRPEIESLVHAESAQVALDTVYRWQSMAIVNDCHVPAHWIGEANLEANHGDIAMGFATCATGCIEGCYHGVIEAHVVKEGLFDDGVAVCTPLADDESLLYRQCLHGFGHAVIRHGNISLPEALRKCEQQGTPFAAEICAGGVQMEYYEPYIAQGVEAFKIVVPDICDPLEIPQQYMSHCIGSMGYAAAVVTGHNEVDAKAICLLLHDQKNQRHCLDSVVEEIELNQSDLNRHFSNSI